MRSIKEYYPTASSAIKGMVEGLIEIPGTEVHGKLFKIDMSTFGAAGHTICFGCAATCAILNADPSLPVDMYARDTVNFIDLFEFESSINCLRVGGSYKLLRFYLTIDQTQKIR